MKTFIVLANTPEQIGLAVGAAVALGKTESSIREFMRTYPNRFIFIGADTSYSYMNANEEDYCHNRVDLSKGQTQWLGVIPPKAILICGHAAVKNADGTLQVGCTTVTQADLNKAIALMAS